MRDPPCTTIRQNREYPILNVPVIADHREGHAGDLFQPRLADQGAAAALVEAARREVAFQAPDDGMLQPAETEGLECGFDQRAAAAVLAPVGLHVEGVD